MSAGLTTAEWIMLAGFGVTIATLIWRMAILHHQCFANKDGLLRAHERIDEIKKTQTDKVEELAAQLNFLKEVQIRMEEKLNLLLDFEKTRFEKVTATTRMRKG